jgi:hypothetical protein
MMWNRETSEVIREAETVRQQLIHLTAQLDGFVERLKAATDDTREEEGRGQAEG